MVLLPILTNELAKVAVQKFAGLKMEDALKAVEALRRAATRGSLFVPGLGVLGVGIAIGAGIGMLYAPRKGSETRAALRDMARQRALALRARVARNGAAQGGESGMGGVSSEPRSTTN
jgi:hypothetical protein